MRPLFAIYIFGFGICPRIREGAGHADLYRLTSSFEIEELGLSDAFHDAICLVEWPDRLGCLWPDHALELAIEATGDDTRHVIATWIDEKWSEKLDVWQP